MELKRIVVGATVLGAVATGSMVNPADAYVAKVYNSATLCASVTLVLHSEKDGGGKTTLVKEGKSTAFKDFNSFWIPTGHHAEINFNSYDGNRVFTRSGPGWFNFVKSDGLTRTFDVEFFNDKGLCS